MHFLNHASNQCTHFTISNLWPHGLWVSAKVTVQTLHHKIFCAENGEVTCAIVFKFQTPGLEFQSLPVVSIRENGFHLANP